MHKGLQQIYKFTKVYLISKKKRPCQRVDIVVPVDHREKMKKKYAKSYTNTWILS